MLRYSKFRVYVGIIVMFAFILAPISSACSQESNPEKIQDNELVVSKLDDSGEIQEMQVLNHMRIFGSGNYLINDGKNYDISSVRNLYSTDKIEPKDGHLSLQGNIGDDSTYQDLYYLATINKKELDKIQLPVTVNVDYYLDGNKVNPSELAGKSGHLKIVCQVENTTGETMTMEFTDSKGELVKKETQIYTPYVVSLSGWEFDNSKFSNIKAPGVAGESPEGVLVNVKGVTSVSWSIPLVPPKYPAKQYAVLEADGKNMELPSFKIAAIPILPTTSEISSLGMIQDSFNKLYDGFDQIQKGVGARNQQATLLFGLGAVKDGLYQVSGGINTLGDKIKQVRFGLSNPAFNASSYNTAKGTDNSGNKPGVKDAVGIIKSSVDSRLVPALQLQKTVLGSMETSIGKSSDSGQEPSAATSLYNDINYLKTALAGSPSQKVITDVVEPKLNNMRSNVAVFRDGGTLVTAGGSMAFPASVKAVEEGSQLISAGLTKAEQGLGLMVLGLGQVDKNGQPVKIMVNGKPGSILYALSYLESNIDNKVIPGITQLQEGAGKISTGAGEAKSSLAAGLQTFESADLVVSALEENAIQADSFLGKPDGAEGTVAYIYQTPAASKEASAMKYGLAVIVIALILLFAIGRSPKQAFQAPAEEKA